MHSSGADSRLQEDESLGVKFRGYQVPEMMMMMMTTTAFHHSMCISTVLFCLDVVVRGQRAEGFS